jgi:HTH-type transcriptional regulator / antitoxin HigA
MAKQSKQIVRRQVDDNYLKLVHAFPLRPIRSEAELDRAIEVIDSLVDRDDLDSGEEDYLDVLSDLVHKHEAEHDPIAPVADADLIQFLLESNDMTQSELAQRTGIAESTVSEILGRKRKLGRRHIAALSRVFRVSPALFFPEAPEMTPERVAKLLKERRGIKASGKLLDSLASAFVMDQPRMCWRALQELVAGERPGTPIELIAKTLNVWGDGGSCWLPSPFRLTAAFVQELAGAFSKERECWKVFCEMVEARIPEIGELHRQNAEEN